MRDKVQIFKALADETRLKMLALLLKHGELCVCDFEQGLGISQSKASRHLRTLFSAGLLEDRREAVWVHYRLNRKQDVAQRAVMKTLETLFSESSGEMKETLVQFDRWLKNKCCEESGTR